LFSANPTTESKDESFSGKDSLQRTVPLLILATWALAKLFLSSSKITIFPKPKLYQASSINPRLDLKVSPLKDHM